MKYVLAVVASLFASVALAAEPARQVAVSGNGSVDVSPDNANITISVVTTADSVKASMKANSTQMQKVMTLLKGEYSLKTEDLCTHNFSIYPQYDTDKDGKRMSISGWETINRLVINVKDISKAGDIMSSIGSLDKANSIRVDGIRFIVSDALRNSVLDKAREAAVNDAKNRAKLYAETAGAKLGEVIAIVEKTSYNHYADRAVTSSGRMEGAGGVPVSAGKSQVIVDIAVTFSLK